MNPVEVLNKLRSLKTARSRQTFLKKLPPEHEFWYGAHVAVDIFRSCYPVYGDPDPETYGHGVPHGIFKRIVELSTEPNTHRFYRALEEFSKRCTEEEWTQWYGPIVRGKLIIPLSPMELQEARPTDVILPQIEKTRDVSFRPIHQKFHSRLGAPGMNPFSVEPFYEVPRALVFVGQNPIAFDPGTGQRIEHPMLQRIDELYDKFLTNVVMDVYLESEEIIILRDAISPNSYFNGVNGMNMDLAGREDALEAIAEGMNGCGLNGVDIIERHYVEDTNVVKDQVQLFLEQGYKGIVFIENPEPMPIEVPILALPDKKNVLTCTDIISGEGGYEGKVEYLIGRGTHNKKRFTQRIFYGLNWEQRDTYFRDRDQLIGKRFEVLSCGFGHNKLIMPTFQQWRQ